MGLNEKAKVPEALKTSPTNSLTFKAKSLNLFEKKRKASREKPKLKLGKLPHSIAYRLIGGKIRTFSAPFSRFRVALAEGWA
jgi:hypothetical protein